MNGSIVPKYQNNQNIYIRNPAALIAQLVDYLSPSHLFAIEHYCSFLIPLSIRTYWDFGEKYLSLCLHFYLGSLFTGIGCRRFWTYPFLQFAKLPNSKPDHGPHVMKWFEYNCSKILNTGLCQVL